VAARLVPGQAPGGAWRGREAREAKPTSSPAPGGGSRASRAKARARKGACDETRHPREGVRSRRLRLSPTLKALGRGPVGWARSGSSRRGCQTRAGPSAARRLEKSCGRLGCRQIALARRAFRADAREFPLSFRGKESGAKKRLLSRAGARARLSPLLAQRSSSTPARRVLHAAASHRRSVAGARGRNQGLGFSAGARSMLSVIPAKPQASPEPNAGRRWAGILWAGPGQGVRDVAAGLVPGQAPRGAWRSRAACEANPTSSSQRRQGFCCHCPSSHDSLYPPPRKHHLADITHPPPEENRP
jgi:hypothetical protein